VSAVASKAFTQAAIDRAKWETVTKPGDDTSQAYFAPPTISVDVAGVLHMRVSTRGLAKVSAFMAAALSHEDMLRTTPEGDLFLEGDPSVWKRIFAWMHGNRTTTDMDWVVFLKDHPHFILPFKNDFERMLANGKQCVGPVHDAHYSRIVQKHLASCRAFVQAWRLLDFYLLSPDVLNGVTGEVFTGVIPEPTMTFWKRHPTKIRHSAHKVPVSSSFWVYEPHKLRAFNMRVDKDECYIVAEDSWNLNYPDGMVKHARTYSL